MTKKRDKPLHIDMSFDEALKRFAQTEPRELSKDARTPRKKRRLKPNPSVKRPTPPGNPPPDA
jgi:hypothetical protein